LLAGFKYGGEGLGDLVMCGENEGGNNVDAALLTLWSPALGLTQV